MKTPFLKFLILATFVLVLQSTTCYEPYNPYSEYKPILMRRDVLESSVAYRAVQTIIEPGKIYLKGDTIYIVEKYKGIHIVQNSDPSNPQRIGFITIPGCMDLAIKRDVLFADNSVDLVAVKLTADLANLSVTSRVRNIFPELTPPDSRRLSNQYSAANRPENTVIVGWEKIKTTY
jgi:hypothetical protein